MSVSSFSRLNRSRKSRKFSFAYCCVLIAMHYTIPVLCLCAFLSLWRHRSFLREKPSRVEYQASKDVLAALVFCQPERDHFSDGAADFDLAVKYVPRPLATNAPSES